MLWVLSRNNARLLTADATTRLYFQPMPTTTARWPPRSPSGPGTRPAAATAHWPTPPATAAPPPSPRPPTRPAWWSTRWPTRRRVTNATTNEDTQTTSGLVISRNAADGAEVTHFKITGISNGTLYQERRHDADQQRHVHHVRGRQCRAEVHADGQFQWQRQLSRSGLDRPDGDAGLGGSTAVATITVTSVNDAPVLDNTQEPDADAQSTKTPAHPSARWARWSRAWWTSLARGTGGQRHGRGQRGPAGHRRHGRRHDQRQLVLLDQQRHELERPGSRGQSTTPACWPPMPTRGSTSSPTPTTTARWPPPSPSGAWDQTSGSNGALADTTSNGGSTAFSTATDTASLVVDPVADTPSVTNATTNEEADIRPAAGDLTQRRRRRRSDPFQDHRHQQRHALPERRDDADQQWHVHHASPKAMPG